MLKILNPKRRLLALVALFVSVSLFAAACGSDDDDNVVDDTAPDGQVVTGDDPTTSTADAGQSQNRDDGDGTDTTTPLTTTTTEPPLVATGGGCTEGRRGGEITMGVFSEAAGLDPTVASASGVAGLTELSTLYDVLMRLDRNTGEYIPQLAESLTSNEDSSVWTLKLREGIRFGNGDPLNAEAVIASMERWYELDAAVGQRNASRALVAFFKDNMEAVDDLTVVFTLNEPWGTFPAVLAGSAGLIVNVNAIPVIQDGDNAGKPDIPAFSRNPVGAGAGPYEIARFAPGEEIVVRAKDDYWGGPVCIEEITFVRVPGAPATYDAWQADDLDIAFLREPRVIAEARENGDDNALIYLQNMGGVVLINNGVRDYQPPTADLRLRQAIFYALDPNVMNQRAHDGTGVPGKSLLSTRSQFYDADLFPEFPTDPDRARQLVEEVKAEGNWDGRIVLSCHNAPSLVDWAIAAEILLEDVGFEVEVENDGNILSMIASVVLNADYDISCWGFNLADDVPFISMLQHTCNAFNNRTGYCSEAMDAAVSQLRDATNAQETQAALAAIWAEWQETIPSVPYETIEEYILFKDEVRGVIGTQAQVVLFHDAYLES